MLRKRYGKQTLFFLLYYICFSNVILAVGYTEHENMWKDFFFIKFVERLSSAFIRLAGPLVV